MSDRLMLEQVLIEQTHNKREISNIIKAEIINSYEAGDFTPIDKAIEDVEEWLWKDDHGYESKNKRIIKLRSLSDFTVEDIVLDAITCVLTGHGRVTIQNMAAYVASSFDLGDVYDNIKTASELVAVIGLGDVYDIILPRDSDTGTMMVEARYELPQDVIDDISVRHYLPPMLVKPNRVTNNFDCGYMTVREHVVLKPHNSDNTENLNYEALNVTNSIAMALDTHMLKWDEEPTDKQDTAEKLLNFHRMAKASRRVYDLMLRNGNKFYMPNRYCARGRMHMQGYHVNLQSNKYKRALVNLAKKEIIGGI